MSKEDQLRMLIEDLLNEKGLWNQFTDWAEEKGEDLEKLGFETE